MKIKNHFEVGILWSLHAKSRSRFYYISISFFVALVILSSIQIHVFADESADSVDKNPVTIKSTTTQKVMSPREQIELGIPPAAVVCNVGFQLIFKASDGSPACVKPDSIENLVARGWAQSTDWQDYD